MKTLLPTWQIRLCPGLFYILAGLDLGYFTWMSLMMGVWGAPTDGAQLVALFGALGLMCSGFINFVHPTLGCLAAIPSLGALGFLWLPSLPLLLPNAETHISPLAVVPFGLYFCAWIVATFWPLRYFRYLRRHL
jgi:hypothetical protein